MRSSYDLSRLETSFDEDNLVPNAGLVPAAALAQKLGLAETVEARVRLPVEAAGRANSGTKALTVIGAMLAGGDSIDDCEVLRAGATPEVFDDVRAPSTIGTWLRGFNWAAVRQLDAVSRQMLRRAWQAGLGPDLDADLMVDFDSTICETYGLHKQGGGFGYTGVRGYHPLIASVADTSEVVHSRMRGGNAASARGADSFARETFTRVRDAGTAGQVTARADSAFYSGTFISACRDHNVRFSVTVRMVEPVRQAIEAIPDQDWVGIPYWMEGGAEVAETTYTAFKGTKHQVELRLIVRRVRPSPGTQLALDVVFDYHPFLTDREGSTLDLEADHRRHATIELAIRDLKASGLAHLPSGKFAANAAWLALAVMAHNLARWTLTAAGDPFHTATTETFRAKIVSMPARLVHTARRLKLRAPTNWPWRDAYHTAHATIGAIPAPT